MSDEYVAMVSPGRAALAPANVRVIKKKNPMTKHAQLLKKGLSKIKAKEIKVVKPAKVLKAKVGLSFLACPSIYIYHYLSKIIL